MSTESIKCVSALTGETRRWNGSLSGSMVVDLTSISRKVKEAFGHSDQLCFSYVDDEGDAVIFSPKEWRADLELREANRAMAKGVLKLTVHASKAEALATCYPIMTSRARHAEPETKVKPMFSPESLGPRPGRVVALDLGVPLEEARELVRRASDGDDIARRVVAPSALFWDKIKVSQKHLVLDNEAFTCALERRRGNEVAHHTRVFSPPAATTTATTTVTVATDAPKQQQQRQQQQQHKKQGVHHHGVACDACDMSPIIGARYHRAGDDYDLCQADYDRLPPQHKARFVAIETPHLPPRRLACQPPPSSVLNSTPMMPSNTPQQQQPKPATPRPRPPKNPDVSTKGAANDDGGVATESDDEIVFVSPPDDNGACNKLVDMGFDANTVKVAIAARGTKSMADLVSELTDNVAKK